MRWLILLPLLAAGLMPSREARACSCLRQTIEEGAAQASAIFEGTVKAVTPNTETQFRGREVTLEVSRAWKGVDSPEVKVLTAGTSAACGYPFTEGSTYLVYAHKEGSSPLRVSLCSHTKLIDTAKPDLKHLGKAPKTLQEEESGRGCSASLGAGRSVGAWAMPLLLGAWLARRRRRS